MAEISGLVGRAAGWLSGGDARRSSRPTSSATCTSRIASASSGRVSRAVLEHVGGDELVDRPDRGAEGVRRELGDLGDVGAGAAVDRGELIGEAALDDVAAGSARRVLRRGPRSGTRGRRPGSPPSSPGTPRPRGAPPPASRAPARRARRRSPPAAGPRRRRRRPGSTPPCWRTARRTSCATPRRARSRPPPPPARIPSRPLPGSSPRACARAGPRGPRRGARRGGRAGSTARMSVSGEALMGTSVYTGEHDCFF